MYDSDTCPRLDVDGGCEGRPEKRRHQAVVTVALETQARTLAERQQMENGELEMRQIDVLFVLSVSAPEVKWDEAEPVASAAASSFAVNAT